MHTHTNSNSKSNARLLVQETKKNGQLAVLTTKSSTEECRLLFVIAAEGQAPGSSFKAFFEKCIRYEVNGFDIGQWNDAVLKEEYLVESQDVRAAILKWRETNVKLD